MKTYTIEKHKGSSIVEVSVNVPSPKEKQSTTILDGVCVVITNFSNGERDSFYVTKFYMHTDPAVIASGSTIDLHPINKFNAQGKNARSDVVDMAANFLLGTY